jgi:hypothetical protein
VYCRLGYRPGMAGRGSPVAAVALAGALLALMAPAASASTVTAGGIKYVTKRVDTKATSMRTVATAPCPKGTRTIGGGEATGAGFGQITLQQTFPYDDGDKGSKPDDGWRAQVAHDAGTQVRIKVTAVCGDTKVRYRNEKFDVPSGDQVDQDTGCPNDMFAFSGGIEAKSSSPIYLNSTFPFTDTEATAWGSYVDNPGSATKATEHVVCGKSKLTSVIVGVDNIGTGTQAIGPADCPPGRFLYGGGQSNNGGYQSLAINTLAPASPTAWLAKIDKFAAYTVNMDVFALCGKPLD